MLLWVGCFLGLCVCIFGRAILFLFQMVVCEVSARVCYGLNSGIVVITILVLWLEW